MRLANYWEGFDLGEGLWYFYKNFLKLRKCVVADSVSIFLNAMGYIF